MDKKSQQQRSALSLEVRSRKIIIRLEKALNRLSYAMDDYNFDKIHWHLYTIYECYAALDTLSGAAYPDTTYSIVTAGRGQKMRTQSFIDSFITVMEQLKRSDTTRYNDSATPAVPPVVLRKKDAPSDKIAQLKDSLFNPLKIIWKDSSLRKVDIAQKNTMPQNPVKKKVTTLKEKTAEMHRYFDAGEFIMSRSALEWLIEYLSGIKTDIINYIASRHDT